MDTPAAHFLREIQQTLRGTLIAKPVAPDVRPVAETSQENQPPRREINAKHLGRRSIRPTPDRCLLAASRKLEREQTDQEQGECSGGPGALR